MHVHPCSMLMAYYDEKTKPWEGMSRVNHVRISTWVLTTTPGGIITSFCNSFESQDGAGHGVKLEPTNMIVCLPCMPNTPTRCSI